MKTVLTLLGVGLLCAILAILAKSLLNDGDEARRKLLGLPPLGPSYARDANLRGGEEAGNLQPEEAMAEFQGAESGRVEPVEPGPAASVQSAQESKASRVEPAKDQPLPGATDTIGASQPTPKTSPQKPIPQLAQAKPAPPVDSPWLELPIGQVVATFESTLGPDSSFLLHGTLPVPAGTLIPGVRSAPFALRNPNGDLLATQLEAVSRFANPGAGADVIEVIAQVQAAPGARRGDLVRFDLVLCDPSETSAPATRELTTGSSAASLLAQGPAAPGTGLAQLLAQPSAIRLSGRDASGALFALAPLAEPPLAILRDGAVEREVKTYGLMELEASGPESGGPKLAPLPHLFGVHAYARVFAGGSRLELDLRINNGASGLDEASSPLNDVYFAELTLDVPDGFVVLEDVAAPGSRGQATGRYDLVAPATGETAWTFPGPVHFMPAQAQFHRRLVIVPAGSTEAKAVQGSGVPVTQAGLAFCSPGKGEGLPGGQLLSWSNPATPSFLAQAQVLPSLQHLGIAKLRADQDREYRQGLQELVAPGKADQPRLGWAHPFGVAYGGMTGGSGIHLLEGVTAAMTASQPGYQSLVNLHRRQTDRMPVAFYNSDGQPGSFGDWVQPATHPGRSDYVPFSYFNGSTPTRHKPGKVDAFGYHRAPGHQLDFVRSQGLQPDYEAELAAFQPHDTQHLIRYTRAPKALAWLGNDSLAKDDLWLLAETFRLEYHQLPNSSGGYVQGTGLLAAMAEVEQRPGKGFDIGRGQGWGLDAVAATYALSRDDSWRERTRTQWLDVIVDLVAAGQSECSGIIQSKRTGRWLGGKYQVRQSIEQAILESGLEAILVRAYRDVDLVRAAELDRILRASYRSMISDLAWPKGNGGPWSHLAVGTKDGSEVFCDAGDLPGDGHDEYTDGYQVGQSLARGFARTGEQAFLERAAELAGDRDLRRDLEAGGLKNIANLAALLELAQRLDATR